MNYVYGGGQTREVEAPNRVGWAWDGCPLSSRLGMEKRREIRGEAAAANAFSAYCRPQNASRRKNKFSFSVKLSSMNSVPTIFLSLSSTARGDCPYCPLGHATDSRVSKFCIKWGNSARDLVVWFSGKSLNLLPQISDFKAKIQQIQFRPGLRPRHRRGSLPQRSPDSLAGFKGPASKGGV